MSKYSIIVFILAGLFLVMLSGKKQDHEEAQPYLPTNWDTFIDACYYDKIEIVKKCIADGADVNKKYFSSPRRASSSNSAVILDTQSDEYYPIMYAIEHQNHEIIELLFSHGVKLDVVNRFDTDLLMLAVINRDIWTVNYLIEKGININRKSSSGKTAVSYTGDFDSKEIYEFLKSKGAEIDFNTAIKNNDFSVIEQKIKTKNVQSNGSDSLSSEHLIMAGIYGDLKTVNLLIEHGAAINPNNNKGASALMHACLEGKTDIAKALLDHGANVNYRANNDESAIIWAIRSNKLELVKLLISRGAEVNVKDASGMTLLMCSSHNYSMTKYLYNHGATLEGLSKSGMNVLDYAKLYRNEEVVDFLQNKIQK